MQMVWGTSILCITFLTLVIVYGSSDNSLEFSNQKKQITELVTKFDGLREDIDSYIERSDKLLDKQAETIADLQKTKDKIDSWKSKSQAGMFVNHMRQEMCNKILKSLDGK